VPARNQQRWIWNGLAISAESIIFWCWRDEVFGQESAGFGIIGDDGCAGERVAALQKTGGLLAQHRELLAAYHPAPASVGLLFSPQSYYLCYSQEGSASRTRNALFGYGRALLGANVPFTVVEEEHLDGLKGLSVLFMPRVLVTDEAVERRLEQFVRGGGTLVCESECGAFDSRGIYRYPQDRFTARLSGISEVGRCGLTDERVRVSSGQETFDLAPMQWLTPWQAGKGDELATHTDGSLVTVVPVGKGRLVLCGSYFGEGYLEKPGADFERFVRHLAQGSGWRPQVTAEGIDGGYVYVKYGASGERCLVFLLAADGVSKVQLSLADAGLVKKRRMSDLLTGRTYDLSVSADGLSAVVEVGEWGVAVMVEEG
jgi:beta-galactosidase